MNNKTKLNKYSVCGIIETHSWIYVRDILRPNRDKSQSETEALLDAHLALGMKEISLSLGRSCVQYHTEDPRITMFAQEADKDQMRPGDLEYLKELEKECFLRTAVDYGQKHDMTVYGTLCMNRHYSGGLGNCMTSLLARRPEMHEIGKNGKTDGSRLCFALEEYCQERLAIIREAAQIGVAGICLDFVRQPPMLRYHPALTEAYKKETGKNPPVLSRLSFHHVKKEERQKYKDQLKQNGLDISGQDTEEFFDWCKWRANVLTRFMRKAREALRKIELETGRRILLIARIPDDGFTANIISGTDIETWCEEGLIDCLMTHPLQWLHGIWVHDVSPYVDLGRRTGVKVYGGVNTYPVAGGWELNPVRIAQRVKEQYNAGVAGINLYETNDAVLHPVLFDLLKALHNYEDLTDLLSDEDWIKQWPINGFNYNCGMDNHSGSPRFVLDEV